MEALTSLPWMAINDYLLEVGQERNPRDFCLLAFRRLKSLIPFDTGMLYILDDNLAPIEQHFIGINKHTSKDYLEYYSKIEGNRFSYIKNSLPQVTDWTRFKDCEFKNNFLRPIGVTCSSHIKFFNSDRWQSACFEINRTGRSPFTPNEKKILKIVDAHLANLFGNFYVDPSARKRNASNFNLSKPLTPRETEIVDLLLKGISPKQISIRKFVSLKTTYNHMANIFEKAGVSNQRELLVKLMQESKNN